MFCQEDAFPKDIDKLGVVARVFNGIFEVNDVFAVNAENRKKFIPKSVFFTAFVGLVFIVVGEILCSALELEQGFHDFME